jgi:threonine/homoserine/homoserine lactone efflux protein
MSNLLPILMFVIAALHWRLKIIGVSYLLMLAYKIASQPMTVEGFSGLTPNSFFGGVLFQWINPKAWVIAIGGISAVRASN